MPDWTTNRASFYAFIFSPTNLRFFLSLKKLSQRKKQLLSSPPITFSIFPGPFPPAWRSLNSFQIGFIYDPICRLLSFFESIFVLLTGTWNRSHSLFFCFVNSFCFRVLPLYVPSSSVDYRSHAPVLEMVVWFFRYFLASQFSFCLVFNLMPPIHMPSVVW